MIGIRDHRLLALCRSAPQEEYHRLFALIEMRNDTIGKFFPADALMRVRLIFAHRQDCIEKKHTLLSPMPETTVIRHFAAEIALKLLEDIDERRRWFYARLDRKTQSVCLTRAVIRVLSQDNDLHLIVRRIMHRIENIIHIGIDRPCFVLFYQYRAQFLIILFLHLRF